jgi:hypothetical protein
LAAGPKKDNSTLRQKVALRRSALQALGGGAPVILESHGGKGEIFKRCYSHVEQGVVFETDPRKTAVLSRQRPTWAVYEADCVSAMGAGVGFHLPFNFADFDPYGDPWPVVKAFLGNADHLAGRLVIVVNDGLRQGAKMGIAWQCESLQEAVAEHGNAFIYEHYLTVCQELMQKAAAQAGYSLSRWTGYYCGHAKQMTHYAAVLERKA